VFEWFCEVYDGESISWQELSAWCELTQTTATAQELRLIKKIALKYDEVKNGRSNTSSQS
jgi:hypothetical protein